MRAQTKTLYQYSKANAAPLLGSNSFDFWAPYLAAYNVYDRYFYDRFRSWYYYPSFDDNTTTQELYEDFIDAVQAHIAINQKRYSELFKVHVLAADAYDIVNNYDLTETHSTTRSGSGTNVYGAREDSESHTIVDGAREDTSNRTIVDGEREDSTSGSATDGARTDTADTVAGAQNSTSEKAIAGFNSDTYNDSDKTETITAAHTDTSTVNKGAQTNTTDSTINKGAQTNTDNSTLIKGAQTNTDNSTTNKGAQTDTHTDSGTENSNIRRYGNIGVQTAAEIIGGHIKLWESFNFYKMIFEEIAKDYFLLDYDYDYESESSSTGGIDVDTILNAIATLSNQVAAGFTAGAKSAEITPVAKSSELADLAKSSELTDLAKSSELTDLAKSSELTDLAKSSELTDLAKSSELADLADSADVNDIRGDILDAKADIVESIEGVSTDEY